MYVSRDLEHWQFRGFMFPPGHQPWEALAPDGSSQGGRYWSPEIHRIDGRWVDYFSARIDSAQFELHEHQTIARGTFGLFVAWTDRLFSEDWHTILLHYRDQFNGVPGNPQELNGGVIDPSVATDPTTGQLYIAYAEQPNQIYLGELNPNGLAMNEDINLALGPTYEWQCDPGPLGTLHDGCVVEGPVLYFDGPDEAFDLFYNSASTWHGSYKVGVAVSADPMGSWVTYPDPILQSGDGLLGPASVRSRCQNQAPMRSCSFTFSSDPRTYLRIAISLLHSSITQTVLKSRCKSRPCEMCQCRRSEMV